MPKLLIKLTLVLSKWLILSLITRKILINLLFDEHTHGEGTAVFQDDWAVLDQIIISQAVYDGKSGLGIQGKDAEIIKKEELLFTNRGNGEQKPNATYGGNKYYGGYSDHLPVYIILN